MFVCVRVGGSYVAATAAAAAVLFSYDPVIMARCGRANVQTCGCAEKKMECVVVFIVMGFCSVFVCFCDSRTYNVHFDESAYDVMLRSLQYQRGLTAQSLVHVCCVSSTLRNSYECIDCTSWLLVTSKTFTHARIINCIDPSAAIIVCAIIPGIMFSLHAAPNIRAAKLHCRAAGFSIRITSKHCSLRVP